MHINIIVTCSIELFFLSLFFFSFVLLHVTFLFVNMFIFNHVLTYIQHSVNSNGFFVSWNVKSAINYSLLQFVLLG